MRTYREIKLLKYLDHENVLSLLDCFTPVEEFDEFSDVYIVTQLMSFNLENVILAQKLSDDQVKYFTYQLLSGLTYCHSAGIIHRDLKPENIGINKDCHLRILDFGLARPTEPEMTGYVVTRWYRAPEIILHWTRYNQTVDVWSVGCIMAEMLTQEPLFPGRDT